MRRNYPLLLVSQFLSAFGDNAILLVIIGQLTYLHRDGIISLNGMRMSNAILQSLLFVPYVLLAPVAGYLSDRFAKTRWLAGGNALKLAGTLVCMISLSGGYWWQGAGYLLVGIGACVYSPAKYGILPEILERDRLVKANGMLELLTLLAILTGGVAGGILSDRFHDRVGVSYGILLGLFTLSLGLNLVMKPTPSSRGVRWRTSVGEFTQQLRQLTESPRLSRVLMGTTAFWLCGASMKINFQAWGVDVLGLPDNTQIMLLGLWLAVGVMGGSLLAGRWYRIGDLRRTQAWGLTLAGCLAVLFLVERFQGWLAPTFVLGSVGPDGGGIRIILPVVLLLVGAGVVSGLFLIPLNATLQAESDPAKLGKTIAGQNALENLGMMMAGGLAATAPGVGISASGLFLVLALIMAGVSARLRMGWVRPLAGEEADAGAISPGSGDGREQAPRSD
jgi:LPLT family lysophospholipid transporter-like MFS transporter